MTQSKFMSRSQLWMQAIAWVVCICLPAALPAEAQTQEESLRIYTEHPRLFLGSHRLKLLRKERERRSLRWQQFELLMAVHAPMTESGFANALYYRIAQDQNSGRSAVAWALGPGTDLRQIALIFDWCQALFAPGQGRA